MTHFLRIPRGAVCRAWMDDSQTRDALAAQLGISGRGLQRQARNLGLPPRRAGAALKIKDTGRLLEMWDAGVTVDEICRHFKVTAGTVRTTLSRLGAAKRRGQSAARITISEFLMMKTAKAEHDQFEIAEMVDKVRAMK